MKISKTPLWKKSCLCGSLGIVDIEEWLDEVGNNGNPYGYEDGTVEGYYNDYKDEFDELSAGAYNLLDTLQETDNDFNELREVWDDFTVALLGDLYTVWGFDVSELDYYRLINGYQEDHAVQEAEKRLMRYTKADLIWHFKRVLKTLVLFFDIKAAHDCLTSIVETLDEKGALLEQKNERINKLYEDLTGRNEEAFEEELRNLPPRMWVE